MLCTRDKSSKILHSYVPSFQTQVVETIIALMYLINTELTVYDEGSFFSIVSHQLQSLNRGLIVAITIYARAGPQTPPCINMATSYRKTYSIWVTVSAPTVLRAPASRYLYRKRK